MDQVPYSKGDRFPEKACKASCDQRGVGDVGGRFQKLAGFWKYEIVFLYYYCAVFRDVIPIS